MPAPEHTDLAELRPLLLPTPQSLELLTGRCDWSGDVRIAREHVGVASRLLGPALAPLGASLRDGAESDTPGTLNIRVQRGVVDHHAARTVAGAYMLEVAASPAGVTIAAADDEGTRHALATLAQLIRQYGRSIPALRIVDWPSVAVRGVMLDVSRDRVPTMDTLRETIDLLASLKINHLQLYTEHTFAYAGHEDVWRDASPITPGELREIDTYAHERGIEVSANQNCFGHLHRWFRHPRYAALAEIPPGVESWTFETDDGRAFTKHGPFSLCPTDPRSIELVRDMLDQLLPCVRSALVNIGCDEAFDVGQGRSRDAVAARGRAAVYFDHVRAVDQIVRAHGKRSMYWADIALRHPDLLHLAPAGTIALVWGYEGDAPFDASGQKLAGLGAPFWVCPGTSTWCSFVGRTSVRRANLSAAASAAMRHGAGGFLTTDWGDLGHRQPWAVSLHAIAHGAHASWNAAAAGSFDTAASSLHVLGDRSLAIGPWLDDLGDVDAELRTPLRNTNAIFVELHRKLHDAPRADLGDASAWQALTQRAAALRLRLAAIDTSSLDARLADELDLAMRLVEHAAMKGFVCRAAIEQDGPGAIPRGPARIRMAAELAEIAELHRETWLRRSRPGGLDDSTAHFERVIDDYEHADAPVRHA